MDELCPWIPFNFLCVLSHFKATLGCFSSFFQMKINQLILMKTTNSFILEGKKQEMK